MQDKHLAWGFVTITKRNIEGIAKSLRDDPGDVLIVEPKYCGFPDHLLNGDFEVHLYGGHPTIDLERLCVLSDRVEKKTGQPAQLKGLEKDREYRLYPKPELSGDRVHEAIMNQFNHLDIGGKYRFEIAGQYAPTRHLLQDRTLCLFVPPAVTLKPALTYVFWRIMINLWNRRKDKGNFTFSSFSFGKRSIDVIA